MREYKRRQKERLQKLIIERNNKKSSQQNGLLKLQDMPEYLQFNKFIYTGYRPLQTTWQCCKSLIYIHNETFNIYSHLFPAIYFLFTLPFSLPWNQQSLYWIQILIHAQALTLVWLGSVSYHTFMNHKSGENTYNELIKWDLIGIWLSNVLGSVNVIYTGVYCMVPLQKWTIIGIYMIINTFALSKLVNTHNLFERGISFLPAFVFRMLTAYLRIFRRSGGNPDADKWLLYQEISTDIGLLIGVSEFPECKYPGQFDLCFNSHNLLHIFPIFGLLFMHQVIVLDFQWLDNISNGNEICYFI